MNDDIESILKAWSARYGKPGSGGGIDSSIYSRLGRTDTGVLASPQTNALASPRGRTMAINPNKTYNALMPNGPTGAFDYWSDPKALAAIEAYKKSPNPSGVIYHDPATGQMLIDAGGEVPVPAHDAVYRDELKGVDVDSLLGQRGYAGGIDVSNPDSLVIRGDRSYDLIKNAPQKARLR